MKNQVQLITYVDRLGCGNINDLHVLLHAPSTALGGLFGGVHLLPFFTPIDGSDAGFDPIDHTQVDARLGSWPDVSRLAHNMDVMGDVIVNHVSSQSPQYLDWLAKGSASVYHGMFLTMDSVFATGASAEQLKAIYRPRPGLPYNTVTNQRGENLQVWSTFTPEQIDIDVYHAQGSAYLRGIVEKFAKSGIKAIRLDAVGYAVKVAGTACFMLPQTFAFIAEFAAFAKTLDMQVLVEVHSYYQRQIEIAAKVDWVYDFALPPLVLHALLFGNAAPLKRWIVMRPHNAITVLDTHDGIGIIDIGADAQNRDGEPGLVSPKELDALVERIHTNSGGTSRKATGAVASNLDLYQVNCTFFDALAQNESCYLAARAIQFFLPGIPQVYYVGLLAGTNDMALLAQTGVGRDINRHRYTVSEIQDALKLPVVRQLIELIKLRNSHAAFNGVFENLPCQNHEIRMRWCHQEKHIELHVNLRDSTWRLAGTDLASSP